MLQHINTLLPHIIAIIKQRQRLIDENGIDLHHLKGPRERTRNNRVTLEIPRQLKKPQKFKIIKQESLFNLFKTLQIERQEFYNFVCIN